MHNYAMHRRRQTGKVLSNLRKLCHIEKYPVGEAFRRLVIDCGELNLRGSMKHRS